MKIAIVDDQAEDIRMLKEFITNYKKYFLNELSFDYYNCPATFLNTFTKGKYHLIFMDVYMGNVDGIETASQIQQIDEHCLVAFLTSSEQDIWRAVQIHGCFDYIRKDELTFERMKQTLEDAIKKLKLKEKTLQFMSGKQMVYLKISSIQYITASDKYISIVLKDHSDLTYRIPFSKISSQLESQECFLLCNRGVLLNMNYIVDLDQDVFIMKNGATFALRRRTLHKLIQCYHDYQFKKLTEMDIPL